jgi:hypothetical protein
MTAEDEILLLPISTLAALCRKVAEDSAFAPEMRKMAQHLVNEYAILHPLHVRSTNRMEDFQQRRLRRNMARFLTVIAS